MDREALIKLATGEGHALFAEAWFTFLGFLAATAVLHAAADKTGFVPIVACKWISYLLMFKWLSFKIDQLIWFHFPVVDPVNHVAKTWQIGISVGVSSTIAICAYFLVVRIIKSLVDAGAV